MLRVSNTGLSLQESDRKVGSRKPVTSIAPVLDTRTGDSFRGVTDQHIKGLPLKDVVQLHAGNKYPNKAGAGQQRRKATAARRVITMCRESALYRGQIVCREGRDCNSAPMSKTPLWKGLAANSCGKTGYVAAENSRQVTSPNDFPLPRHPGRGNNRRWIATHRELKGGIFV